jgi:membrane-associated phospholipid phosphatase
MSESRQTARKVTRRWPLVSGLVALSVAVAAGALIGLRESNVEFDVDWMQNLSENRSPFWEVPARLMDFLGGGWFGVFVVPISIAVLLLVLAKRRWGAVYFLIASILSALVVQLLKNLYDRARPEDILVVADHGSFPSGHVGNAATLAVTLGIILGRRWVWFAGAVYTVLMLLSRTYLGAHWLSDTVGGLLVGAGVAVIVWAPFAARLHAERPPSWKPVFSDPDTRSRPADPPSPPEN